MKRIRIDWQKLRPKNLINAPARVFLLLTSVFGIVFIFIFPPFQVIDEPSHFFRAYQLAQGEIFGVKKDDMTGGYLPSSVVQAPEKYSRLVFHYEEKVKPGDIKADLGVDTNAKDTKFMVFNNTVVYPPLTYLPQALGIKLSMLFNASPVVSLYFARIASLVCWIVLVYLAIRIIPVGKWALVVIALFPMMLTQAASASSDATINSVSIITISIIIALAAKDWGAKTNKRLLLGLAGAGIVLSLLKLPALMILLLCLIIPSDRFKLLWGKVRFLAVLAVVVAAIVLLWNYFALHLRVDLRPDVSASEQLQFILAYPAEFIKLFVYYPLQVRFDQTIMQMYGWLGWNEIKIPMWIALINFLFLFISLCEPAFKKVTFKMPDRLLSLATLLLASFVITTLLYLTWMPVGFGQLYDLWGRYYVALLPILIVIIGGLFYVDQMTWSRFRKGIIFITPICLLISTVLVLNRYYWSFPLG